MTEAYGPYSTIEFFYGEYLNFGATRWKVQRRGCRTKGKELPAPEELAGKYERFAQLNSDFGEDNSLAGEANFLPLLMRRAIVSQVVARLACPFCTSTCSVEFQGTLL